jgi:hypothetical protein
MKWHVRNCSYFTSSTQGKDDTHKFNTRWNNKTLTCTTSQYIWQKKCSKQKRYTTVTPLSRTQGWQHLKSSEHIPPSRENEGYSIIILCALYQTVLPSTDHGSEVDLRRSTLHWPAVWNATWNTSHIVI